MGKVFVAVSKIESTTTVTTTSKVLKFSHLKAQTNPAEVSESKKKNFHPNLKIFNLILPTSTKIFVVENQIKVNKYFLHET